jgi:hypothetical protein
MSWVLVLFGMGLPSKRQPLPFWGQRVSHVFGGTRGLEVNEQPSPSGRGCPAPALSPAGAGRVRGQLRALALSARFSSAASFRMGLTEATCKLEGPSMCKAVVTHNAVFQQRVAETLPRAFGRATRTMPPFKLRFGCAAMGGPHGQGEKTTVGSFSRRTCPGNGNNPSPVPRRLEKAPSRDTLSPRERAMFSIRVVPPGSWPASCVLKTRLLRRKG